MTPAQAKALITTVFELKARITHIEAMLESQGKLEFERMQLLRDLRTSADHVLRLVRQKEVLLEALGRMALEQQPMMPLTFNRDDIDRVLREMRGH